MPNLATDLARVMAVLDRIQQEVDQYPHNPIGHVVEHNIGASRFREARETITAWNTRTASGGDSASLEKRARELLAAEYDRHGLRGSYYIANPNTDRPDMPDEPEYMVVEAAICAITAALANQQGVGGWQPIETAPKGRNIWAYNGEQEGVMCWREGFGWAIWVWSNERLADMDPHPEQPTHWRPLPTAPTQPAGDVGREGGLE